TGLVTVIFLPLTMNLRLREKRRENSWKLQEVFFKAVAEISRVWKLWNYSYGPIPPVDRTAERRQLLERALQAEYEIEEIIVKICVERELSDAEVETIAKFRQAYQFLRAAIRWEKPVNWSDPADTKLVAFRAGACLLLHLLSTLELMSRPNPKAGCQ